MIKDKKWPKKNETLKNTNRRERRLLKASLRTLKGLKSTKVIRKWTPETPKRSDTPHVERDCSTGKDRQKLNVTNKVKGL